MNDMRKLMESVKRIDEGYFSRLATELDELYRANPNTPDENLIAFVRRKHGDKAADFFRSQIESGEYEQSLEEGHGEETFDEMVDYWKQSLSSSIVSKGVFTQLYDAANNNIDELNSAIADQAYSIAETYHGSGEGIGSSDQNHFIMHIGQSLGIDDLFGWNKPKDSHPKDANWPHASDEEMERDKTNRGAKYGKAIRGEGIEEAKPAHWLADKDRPSAPKPDLSDIEYETCAECGVNGGHKDDCPKLGAMYKEGLSEGESEIDEVVSEWMKRLDRL